MNKLNDKKAITLIALVITIIVMLILVAVTITMAVNGGLFKYAGKATSDTEASKQEELKIAEGGLEVDGQTYKTIDNYIKGVAETPEYSQSLLDSNKVLTKNAKVTQENTETQEEQTAIIPKGFGIVTGCETIEDGLVISDEFDSNGNSIGNEFVWIPVPGKDMTVGTISSPVVVNTNYKEPKILSYDTQANLDKYYGTKEDGTTPYFTLGTDFALENNYSEMANSVNTYGGFYIGRYETTIDSNGKIGSKYNTPILTAGDNIKMGTNPNNSQNYYYRWWGLYYKARHSNVAENGNTVQTNMIWGQQWDRMITFFGNQENYKAIDLTNTYDKQQTRVVNSGTARYTPKEGVTDAEEMNDKIFNIFDLRMNAWDWTAEANDTSSRVLRGGKYNTSYSASSRLNGYNPSYSGDFVCTRLTLYIR